jgi:outer membrane protein W
MRAFRLACIAGILFASNQVLAQSAGTWSGKIGYNEFRPKVDSGDITGVPNGKIDVGNGGSVFGSATYMLTDQTSVELAFGVPPKLDIVGRGTIEKAGKIADTKVWSPILMFQYRLGSPDSLFRPYIGIGGTYTKYGSVALLIKRRKLAENGAAPLTLDGPLLPSQKIGRRTTSPRRRRSRTDLCGSCESAQFQPAPNWRTGTI